MEIPDGARSFLTSGNAYDAYMGRYSRPLADLFADAAGVGSGQTVLDVGCGPGALTGVLVERLGADAVFACDPSAPFVAECAARHPGVDVRLGQAEALPFDDGRFNVALAQLVLHFVSDPEQAAGEMRRAVRPGGIVAACVWDFAEGTEMLRHFWDAALTVDPNALDVTRTLRFGRQGEIVELFEHAGLERVVETTLHVSTRYDSFDEFWSGFLPGIGTAGVFCVGLSDEGRSALRHELFRRVGSPAGTFTLGAMGTERERGRAGLTQTVQRALLGSARAADVRVRGELAPSCRVDHSREVDKWRHPHRTEGRPERRIHLRIARTESCR